jgi:hypothetical protein
MVICRSAVMFDIYLLFIVVSLLQMNVLFYAVSVSMFVVVRNLGRTLVDVCWRCRGFQTLLGYSSKYRNGHTAL